MSATVSVGCKLPWGLVLEMGKVGADDYRRVTLVGSNGMNKGHGDKIAGHIVASGYGITFGVPKDFMDAWMAKHARLDCVRSGLIFVEAAKDAQPHAEMFSGVTTGFEPLSQSNMPRGLETARESA